MNNKELRNLELAKLKLTLKEKNLEYIEKKVMVTSKKEKDISIFKKLKKEIARLNTIINEKEILS